MSTYLTLHLQTQVVSIVEALATSAIAEIRKVIDEGTEVSRLEMSRSNKENETLKWRLLEMEKELEAARKGIQIRAAAGDKIRTVKEQVGDEIREGDAPYSDSYEEEQSFSIDGAFGKECSISLWKDAELAAMKEEAPLQPINGKAAQIADDRPGLFSIKVELFEDFEDSEPQGGLKICDGSFESERDSTRHQYGEVSDALPAPAVATRDPYTRPAAGRSRRDRPALPDATGEGPAEPPAPPQSAAGSDDARRHFLPGRNAGVAKGRERDRSKPLVCASCGTSFSYLAAFQNHQPTCPGRSGDGFCQKGEPEQHESAEIGQETFKSGWFGCERCPKTFGCSYDLETHRALHGEKPFRCDDCGKCYSEKWHLDSHLCSGAGEKPYECADCGSGFSQEAHLSLHQCSRRREDPYGCINSGDDSPQKSKFESQHHIYREGNFYSCAVCQRSFANMSTFEQYLCARAVEKSHRCFECGKCFTERKSLNLHQRTIHAGEKPFSCAECGKNFTQKANLQKHKVIHTGEKPYKCLECGKRFTEKGYLKKHHMIHRGVKPYRCRECGKCFYHKAGLNSHERNHRRQAI